jgi:hypothetical protein
MDGTTEYFPVLHVKKISQNELAVKQLFSNPVQTGTKAVFEISTLNESAIDIQLVDLRGCVIYTGHFISGCTGKQTIELSVIDNLKNGIYFLQVANQYKTINQKIIKT